MYFRKVSRVVTIPARDFLFRNLCAVFIVLLLRDLSLLQLLRQPLLVLSIVVLCSVHATCTKIQSTAKQHRNKYLSHFASNISFVC